MAKYEKYETNASIDASQYSFISIGDTEIEKRVEFVLTNATGIENTYNCAFGDWDAKNRCIVDDSRSNNGDIAQVLATVIGTIFHYTTIYPDRIIYVEGFDEVRTNLYGKIIHDNFEELILDFDIFGIKIEDKQLVPYPFEGIDRYAYFAFMIRRC